MSQLQTFGQQLARVLSAAGIKQEALAEMVGLSQPTISKLKNGSMQPSREHVEAIALACAVSPWALVGGTDLAKQYPGDSIVGSRSSHGVKRS